MYPVRGNIYIIARMRRIINYYDVSSVYEAMPVSYLHTSLHSRSYRYSDPSEMYGAASRFTVRRLDTVYKVVHHEQLKNADVPVAVYSTVT